MIKTTKPTSPKKPTTPKKPASPDKTKKKTKEDKKENNILKIEPTMDTNVYIFKDIEEETAEEFIKDMNDIMDVLEIENSIERDIFVHINTRGGDVSHMFSIIDYIEYAKSRGFIVHIIALGQIMSAGLCIMSSGSKGFRTIGQNTRFMFHQCRSHSDGELSQMRNDLRETEYAQESYLNALIKYSNKDRKFYQNMLDKNVNHYFSADEAIEWGLGDSIL